MKQDLRASFWIKALAFLLALACGVAAILGWFYTAFHWDTVVAPTDYTSTRAYSEAMNRSITYLDTLLRYYDRVQRGETLTYLEQQQYDLARESLDPDATNFRYTVRDNRTGDLLLSSNGEDSLSRAQTVYARLRYLYPEGRDYWYLKYDGEYTLFYNYDNEVVYRIYGKTDTPYAPGEVHQYVVEYGCDKALEVRDAFFDARQELAGSHQSDAMYFYLSIALTVAFLLLTVFLMSCAGRRRGADAFTLNWSDKIPYDLYLAAMWLAIVAAFGYGFYTAREVFWYESVYQPLFLSVSIGLLTLGILLFESWIMSTCSRIKTHTLLRNTMIWRLCKLIGRGFLALGRWWMVTFGSWNMTQKVLVGFLLYLVGTVLTGITVVLIPFYQGAVLFLLCRWTEEWRRIRQGTLAIVGGAPDTLIDPSHMKHFPDLREHAEALNDLGSAINTAVDERMKSERMKAELITNVSHDLKTPLTSIINYVDLLKKEDIQEEKAREYIEVLDRKSQRLKKLTEDLVEASTASTGAMAVDSERLGVIQLVDQAIGEYSEKFAAAELSLLPTFPSEEHYVMADGRHFWRVLDNLLGNCVKYAMPGTRVYLDVTVWDGWVTIALKNISAGQLNIPAAQLMERFVRGDESRTTEGSGLGLSIARSLTELQGGLFRVDVDGDLFKAVVSFPEVK